MVDPASAVLTCIVGFLHFVFWIMETFLWQSYMAKSFRIPKEDAMIMKDPMINQGIYNLGVAVGLFWSVLAEQKPTVIYLLSCVIVYAIVGAATVSWRIFIVQGLPAVIAIFVVIFLMEPRP